MHKKYDTIIIGAGMSGIASGIRLAMYNKKVLIVEKHSIPGGLNSYYQRGKRKFDVGLHALTNFINKNDRGRPFNKLMKQLRIPYDDFKIVPQNYSLIKFPHHQLKFSNSIEVLIEEINLKFKDQTDGFLKLLEVIKNFDEVNLNNKTVMAKSEVKKYITNETLLEMIFCPLLIYGSAWENDMDFSQFVIMFKSIFLEGFGRPIGGVRTIIDLLINKYQELNGELEYKKEVTKILTENGKIIGVEINNNEIIECENILSSMGLPETKSILSSKSIDNPPHPVGKLSFTESIFCIDKKPKEIGVDATIIFYNNRNQYLYKKPDSLYDSESGVLCFPNNFKEDDSSEGILRVTHIANFDLWKNLDKDIYKEEKENVAKNGLRILEDCGLKSNYDLLFKDIFTPTTITKYTGHFNGTVYGSTEKTRDGKTAIDGLYIIGTDQGFLGIVGSILSGISMSNLHILKGSE